MLRLRSMIPLRLLHQDHGVIGVRAVVVPAVNANGDIIVCRLDALQRQIVQNQAGREHAMRGHPRFNDQGLHWIGLDWIGLHWIGLDWIGLDWI